MTTILKDSQYPIFRFLEKGARKKRFLVVSPQPQTPQVPRMPPRTQPRHVMVASRKNRRKPRRPVRKKFGLKMFENIESKKAAICIYHNGQVLHTAFSSGISSPTAILHGFSRHSKRTCLKCPVSMCVGHWSEFAIRTWIDRKWLIRFENV